MRVLTGFLAHVEDIITKDVNIPAASVIQLFHSLLIPKIFAKAKRRKNTHKKKMI